MQNSDSVLFFFLAVGEAVPSAALADQSRLCFPLRCLALLSKCLCLCILCLRVLPVGKEGIFLRNPRCARKPGSHPPVVRSHGCVLGPAPDCGCLTCRGRLPGGRLRCGPAQVWAGGSVCGHLVLPLAPPWGTCSEHPAERTKKLRLRMCCLLPRVIPSRHSILGVRGGTEPRSG